MSRVTLLGLIVFVAVATTSACTAAMPVMTRADYASQLAAVRACLPVKATNTDIARAHSAMVPIVRCDVQSETGGLPVLVDNSPILADIDAAGKVSATTARQADLDSLRRELTLLEGGLRVAVPSAQATSSAIDSSRSLLLTSKFRSEPVPDASLWDRAGKALSDWWDRLMKRMTPTHAAPKVSVDPAVAKALLIIVIALAVGLLVWVVVNLILSRSPVARKARAESALAMSEEEAVLVAKRDFEKLIDLARERRAAGDSRSALRLVFLAVLVHLDSEGLVRLNKSRTNWEYLRDLRSGPYGSVADTISPLAKDFDRTWYGFGAVDDHTMDRGFEVYEAVRRESTALAARIAVQPRSMHRAAVGGPTA